MRRRVRYILPAAVALLALWGGPTVAQDGAAPAQSKGSAVPAGAAPPPAIDPSRFGVPVEPRDAIGAPPIKIVKPRDVTPKAPENATAPVEDAAAEGGQDGIDPQRFGERPGDAAYGAFQRGLYKTAYNLAMVRAEAGDPAAQTLVAEILSRGLGMRRDDKSAAGWYQRAAEQGVPEAQFQYALMLLDGKYVGKDTKEAYALMEAAAAAGNRLAQFNLAQMIVDREGGDAGMAKAVGYYERAAQAGLPDAQYAMAQVYLNGAGGKPVDLKAARNWLTLAARQNFDTAQVDLGTWLVEGRAGQRDMKSGFSWIKRAADAGNVAAQNRVAKLYMAGLGTEPDSILAAAWYISARRSGLIDPEMEDFMAGLTDQELQASLERANRLH
jgi:TPR repeat protein